MIMIDKNLINRIAERSLLHVGNNYRVRTVMEKARNGEPVTIVFLGASITHGCDLEKSECFPAITYHFFSNKFGTGTNIRYINAGIPGTSSLFGLIRVDQDVINYEPDLVFVEFAINDGKSDLNRTSFEGLIARLLESESQPAVVLLFAVAESGYTCQGQMKQVGIHYDLPMISFKEAFFPEIAANHMLWKDFFYDQGHPNTHGHTLIAEMIQHYFDSAYTKEKDTAYELPERAFFGRQLQSMILLDSSNLALDKTGGFKAAQTVEWMKNGWVREAGASMESFTFKLTCMCLFIVYKESSQIDSGTAEVYVDGNFHLALNGYNSLGWNNPVTKLVFQEREAAVHTIELRMAEYDTDKQFTILGFGYCGL
jgi:acyl-CoA thioesterase I